MGFDLVKRIFYAPIQDDGVKGNVENIVLLTYLVSSLLATMSSFFLSPFLVAFLVLLSTMAICEVKASENSPYLIFAVPPNCHDETKTREFNTYHELKDFDHSALLKAIDDTSAANGPEVVFPAASMCICATESATASDLPRGGGLAGLIPAGFNPFGYKITDLGTQYLEFEGSLDSDVGRFLASLKTRKRFEALKAQWLEIVRVAKSAQSMRIYRTLDDLITFCIEARMID
jgi:hypothetical protein